MTTICTITDHDSAEVRMLRMIENLAPRLMRAGGGALSQEAPNYRPGQTLSETKKQRAIELAATTTMNATEIAREVGASQSSIQKFFARRRIQVRDGRWAKGRAQ